MWSRAEDWGLNVRYLSRIKIPGGIGVMDLDKSMGQKVVKISRY